jgi:hypothetical protein
MTIAKDHETALTLRLIAGTRQHFSNLGSLTFGNRTLTPPEIEAALQTLVDLRTAVDAAKALTQAKLVAEQTQAPALRTLQAALVAFVRATFGDAPDRLAEFGLSPRKARTPLTIEQHAVAAAKAKATRAARHTMGKRQKKDVKGTITTIVSPEEMTSSGAHAR